MTETATSRITLRERRQAAWNMGRFAYQTLIAPWPPFIIYLIVSGILGGATPLVQIWPTSGLVNALAAHAAGAQISDASVLDTLAPYARWLLLLIGSMLVNWIVFMDSIQRYLAAQLNERVKERFDGLLFSKAIALRLEQFESPAYYGMSVWRAGGWRCFSASSPICATCPPSWPSPATSLRAA